MTVVNEISLNIEDVLKNLLPEQISAALERAGQLVENESKKKCGVDSGILRASITHQVEENAVHIGSNVEYGPYHHDKNPFLQEAIDENMQEILDCFNNILRE